MVSRHGEFVPVATFGCVSEAHLARLLLESEGILVFLEGVETGGALSGLTGLGDHVRLQVLRDQAGQAVMLLAAAQARTELPDDWEEQAAACSWVCTQCGQPVPNDVGECPTCGIQAEGIRIGERSLEEQRSHLFKPTERNESRIESQAPRATAPSNRPGCLGALLGLWWTW